jgi:peroxiredoxin
MNKSLLYSVLFVCYICQSCAQRPGDATPVVESKLFLKDFKSYYSYLNQQVKFDEDFTTYSAEGDPISKSAFFTLYSSGNYAPVRLQHKEGKRAYRLVKVSEVNAGTDIRMTNEQFGKSAKNEFDQIGKPLTGFNFTDLNGNVYTTEMLKGKIVALKFWFIRCHACNEEMPELNKVVENYKNRKDILFLSLATDSPDQLRAFLKKTKFNYQTIYEPNDYMTKHFGTIGYPTHVLVDKKGIVQLVTSDAKLLSAKLKKETI